MKTLLFDLDGTLVNSIPLWIKANLQSLKKRNVHLTEQEFLTEFYQPGLHYHGILEKCGLTTEKADQFYQERNILFETLLGQEITWIGAAGTIILQQCAGMMPLGLMTGSTHASIKAMDTRLHLSTLFREIVTHDDTGARMKPDPYGLLLLAKRLSVDPRACIYVGDQYVDVQAARAADMTSCLIPTRDTPDGAIEKADIVLENIEKVTTIIQRE